MEQGLFAPPVLVGHNGENLLGGLPAIDLVGSGEVVVVDGIEQAVIEDCRIFHDGVYQAGTEETLDGVVGFGHDDFHREGVAVFFDGCDVGVDIGVYDVVALFGEGLVGHLQSLDVHGGAVVELCLGVELDGDGLHAVGFASFVGGAVVGVDAVLAQGVGFPEAADGGGVDGRHDV